MLRRAVSNEPAVFTVVTTNKTIVFAARFETKRLGAENTADYTLRIKARNPSCE